ncbi:MAG: transcription termination/antitermination factor NusG [Acidobacteria bacterium]|nr:transcription termination/antitermination factor NusG [Acidobacteriota bacterium]
MALRWYIVHTYSGFENKVQESLLKRVETYGYSDRITDVMIPTEQVLEVKNGKRVETTKKFFPGYILVQMEMDDHLWHFVRNTPKVTGFVGGKNPTPLTDEDVENILSQVKTAKEKPKPEITFATGDKVKIIDGPFKTFIGSVEEVNEDKATVRVMVTIFGRSTPVELGFLQVEKI